MTADSPLPADPLASVASADSQRQAARMAQDVFSGLLRQAVAADGPSDSSVVAEVGARCHNWCQAGGSEEGRALRLALLIAGLDQWGLAYTQAFGLTAIPALTALIGSLRTRLDTRADALFQQYFTRIDAVEADAIDFKIELRRAIHLALWHAMAACETETQAAGVLQPLGNLMVALDARMPTLGWRLLADALASIQVCLLTEPEITPLAQESTQKLFASLRHALPPARYQAILAHSGQAVVAWQQTRRPAAG